jgi:hypothetical protein
LDVGANTHDTTLSISFSFSFHPFFYKKISDSLFRRATSDRESKDLIASQRHQTNKEKAVKKLCDFLFDKAPETK